MMMLRSITRSAAGRLGSVALALVVGAAVQVIGNPGATEAVGYLSMDIAGGTVSSRGLSLVSPVFVNPVRWQGEVAAATGLTVTVANADWSAGTFDSRYGFEVASGPHAGVWTEIVSVSGDTLTLADPLGDLLEEGESVRIRRFTTLSDFLGRNNEAGLASSSSAFHADLVTVYHATGIKNYWYYNGAEGGDAGWYDMAWNPAADTVIAPGEGVALQRATADPLQVWQTGVVKEGVQSVIVGPNRNFIGGVVPADISLANSQLYTGEADDGLISGNSLASADSILIHGKPTRTYWRYDGSEGGAAGWYDTAWNPADDVLIKGGSTLIIERRQGEAFVWTLPAFIP